MLNGEEGRRGPRGDRNLVVDVLGMVVDGLLGDGEKRAGNKRHYRIPYLRAMAVLAQWENKLDQAIAHLEAARDLAEQLGLPGEPWQILAALGELYQSCKNESQAQQASARAAQVVQSLAGRIEDEQHRTTFLSAQQVRAVLAHAATERGREMTR